MLLFSALSIQVQGQEISYYGDVKPILDRHCVSCHRAGEVGPMPLTTYEEVSAYGRMIQYVTTSKLMPPWYADPSYAHYSNERVLSESCLLYTSDAADERSSVDLGGRRIIKKKITIKTMRFSPTSNTHR